MKRYYVIMDDDDKTYVAWHSSQRYVFMKSEVFALRFSNISMASRAKRELEKDYPNLIIVEFLK